MYDYKNYSEEYYKKHKKEIRAQQKEYRKEHVKEIKLRDRIYYQIHKEEISRQQREYRQKCKKHKREYDKNRYKSRKEEKKKYNKIYNSNRRILDMNYKIRQNLRSRLRQAIRKNWKAGSAIRDLGCSVEFLQDYLSLQFKPGMNWTNYGEWEIDHIKPLSSVNLSDKCQFLEVVNYKNLRPLWKEDNRARNRVKG